ncbi:MAG: 1,4-dihydroxy-2-naphthoate octaprenyltransferase [Phycisphaerales bacterium]|nr:1,4-dihydroxy-2-naphthoate octaprenyltransferase [Phycisphaerales bacterium]
MMEQCRIWFAATRPRTLTAGFAPVAVGSAIAHGDGLFHFASAGAALCGALGVQIACNFANDLFDARKGADTHERLGPTRAVASGLISARAMLLATCVVVLLTVVPSSAYLALRAGWSFIVLGALSAALAILYTAGRWSIAYHGLGELFALLFFGPIAVAATYAAQATHWNWISAMAGLGSGFLAAALIGVNNLRDESTDRTAHKRTLAVRWGVRFARVEYLSCVAAAASCAIAMAMVTQRWWCASAIAAPIALVPACRRILAGASGRELNGILAATGGAILGYGALLSIGWNL